MNLTLEEVCEKYKLSEDEHNRIQNTINENMLYGKTPAENPVAIIDIAPPGSGKTGLNGMGLSQFPNNNAVIINSDELKPYHPKIDEIAKLYPEYYTKVTNQESNSWTDNLFDAAVSQNYNIIFEGTGRNLKLLRKMISQMSNYTIYIRGMAVNELNCLMSIVERYDAQLKEKGWGRLVVLSHFYKAYEEMLSTIEMLENLQIANQVEVYVRSDNPSCPKMIYNSNNKTDIPNAKFAVIKGRKDDSQNAIKYYESSFKNKISSNNHLLETKEIIDKISDLYISITEYINEK